MKKLNLTFALLFILIGSTTPKTLIAPPLERPTMYIAKAEPVFDTCRLSYEKLVDAVHEWESASGLYLYNPEEEATGPFQIRPIRLADYNRRTGSNYTLEDCYDYDLSKQIFLYYAYGKTYEQAAKDWNGSGPMTIKYWEGVNKILTRIHG